MVVEGLDPVVVSKLTSQQVEQVTCIECCEYYIAPETASCGHTLCHACWKGRRICHTCAAPIDRKILKLNLPLQTLTGHVHTLADAVEKLFNLKLEEFTLEMLDDLISEDPTKHVKEWLANSENHFSAPVTSSQISEPEFSNTHTNIELPISKIQVHTHHNKNKSPEKVMKPPQPQEDWDKIEVLPDTEETNEKPKENIIGPMDLEPFFIEEIEYSNDNPRRSSRKRDLKEDCNPPASGNNMSADKNSAKNSSTDTKSLKSKQTWNSVKKMKREFSKLNKKNKSKLNVSIEMCKKAQKAVYNPKQAQALPIESVQNQIIIDDKTPQSSENQNNFEYGREENEKADLDISEIPNNISDKVNLPDVMDEITSTSQNKESYKKSKSYEPINKNIEDIDNTIDKSVPIVKPNPIILTAYNEDNKMPFIKKSALYPKDSLTQENRIKITQKEVHSDTNGTSSDDIEISIKIGNTITNIVIKDKRNDIEMKVNTEKAVQTSLGPYNLGNKCNAGYSPMPDINTENIQLNIHKNNKVNTTISTKKNTASADTAPVTSTAQFEITDSIERELSDVMEHLERKRNRNNQMQKPSQTANTPTSTKQVAITENKASEVVDHSDGKNSKNVRPQKASETEKSTAITSKDFGKCTNMPEEIEDLDIFNSGSVKASIKLLKDTEVVPSEILVPTMKNYKKSQKVVEKRDRGINYDIELPCSKKQKIVLDHTMEDKDVNSALPTEPQHKDKANDSEPMNYDVIMSQVFANIDEDMHDDNCKNIGKTQVLIKNSNKSQTKREKDKQLQSSQIIHITQHKPPHKDCSVTQDQMYSNVNEDNQKFSENVFTLLEKESDPRNVSGRNNDKLPETTTQQDIDNLLTPGMCRDLAGTCDTDTKTQEDKNADMVEIVHGTPIVDNDDSDSVVEETPQKNLSFTKPKQNDISKNIANNQIPLKTSAEQLALDNKNIDSQIIRSIINISDTLTESSKVKDTSVVEMAKKTMSLSTKEQVSETPLTMNKFFNHIKHNSTPVARKSLNFDSENLDDPEQTLCPTTTQEKAFLSEAFKQTPISPIKKALTLKSDFNRSAKKYFVAGSCLSPTELNNLKMLCFERGWTFLDKYTKDLTHLVVGVDEENRSQRSVKYMCALAASKWIVSYCWVEKCLQSKSIVDELPYEALDACGEPGPRRSRTSIKKVFEGITFYCMPPFSILDIHTLKQMLVAAGGRIVEDPKAVKVTEENSIAPALLLAEPEHTQEDRFVYLAMEHQVVPVNFEWALNCLGTYSLSSIQELLLCPLPLLPAPAAAWPAALLAQPDDDYE